MSNGWRPWRFTRIPPPFDGVVIARDTDVGALISAGGGAGPALFVVFVLSRLRSYVSLPQAHVSAMELGAKAVLVPECPTAR